MQKNTIAIGSIFLMIVKALRATCFAELDFSFPEFQSSGIFEFNWTFQMPLCSCGLILSVLI